MLGDQIGVERGKVTGYRILRSDGGPKVEVAFQAAIDEITGISERLLRTMETNAPPKNREEESAKAKARSAARFGD